MKALFWISVIFTFYTYVGYPLLLALLARLFPQIVRRGDFCPAVSVVLAASNEERTIGNRLENLLAQDYPESLYEIIVVSDGSSDMTNEIVASFADRKVILIPLSERVGKAAALNHGVSVASGDIIVFADARQTFAIDAVRCLAANFADTNVGCVSGQLILQDSAGSGIRAEMGAYWRYETAIRKLESVSGSLVGATGAIYAIRNALYQPQPGGTILDDVLTPMNISLQGYRVVFDGAAIAFDEVSKDIDQEWKRKVRTLTGNWQLLSFAPFLLVPWRCPLWWRFLSHKIFRLLVPFALPGIFIACLEAEGMVYRAALFAQLTLYLSALAGFAIPGLRRLRLVNISYFFFVMNAGAVVGFWRWLSGKCDAIWCPAYLK